MQSTSWPVAEKQTMLQGQSKHRQSPTATRQANQRTYYNFRGSGLWLLGNHSQGLPSFMIGRLDLVVRFVIFIERIQRVNAISTIVQTNRCPQTQGLIVMMKQADVLKGQKCYAFKGNQLKYALVTILKLKHKVFLKIIQKLYSFSMLL